MDLNNNYVLNPTLIVYTLAQINVDHIFHLDVFDMACRLIECHNEKKQATPVRQACCMLDQTTQAVDTTTPFP